MILQDHARTSPVRRRLALAAGLATLAGCGPRSTDKENTVELSVSESLDQGILAVWRDGGETELAALVDIGFEDLVIIPEGTPAERVHEVAGTTLLSGEYYHSSTQLFLFRASGTAVLAAMVAADVFEHEIRNATFGPGVRLVGEGGQSLITLRD